MTLNELHHLESSPPSSNRAGYYHRIDRHDSAPHLKDYSLSSAPSESDWVSPFTLPPLPSFRRDRDPSDTFRSSETLGQRDGSGAYYAAAWGSPYATPSPRRTPPPSDSARQGLNFEATPLPSSSRSAASLSPGEDTDSSGSRGRRRLYGEIDPPHPVEEGPNLRSEKSVWLSDSDDSGSESGKREGEHTPTRIAYFDSWGASPTTVKSSRSPVKHRSTESLATITQDTFHVSDSLAVASTRHRLPFLSFSLGGMAEKEHEKEQEKNKETKDVASPEKPLPVLPRRTSQVEEDDNPLQSPMSAVRPRPMSIPSYQRPKKKVIWKGKACIIALPLTDREAAGLPPLLKPEEVKERTDAWIGAGYSVGGFELTDRRCESPVASNGQSRPIYPDSTDVNSEHKLRQFHVHIPDQAEWQSWVDYLKEEKLRALGVSPSSSEAPPSSRSPFSPTMSRVSSTAYPALAASPPIAPSSSASNPLRATSNPFLPSLMSSTGISPQPGSVGSSQFNGLPKNLHAYKASVAHPGYQGRISPYEATLSHAPGFGNGSRPNIQALSSRQNSFSPNHPLHLPNMGEVLSQPVHVRAATTQFSHEQARLYATQGRGHVHPQHTFQSTPSPALPQHPDSIVHTPRFNEPSRTPIEIAHPTPKIHRHNLSMALQREIDEAEAALHAKHDSLHAETEHFELPSRKGSVMDESTNEEPPILRRPETITDADERSEIETNPSMAATPMLMDDEKTPFTNWQALSDAAGREAKPATKPIPPTPKFNVEAEEFDPRAGFSSSNFTFGAPYFAPSGRFPPNSAQAPERPRFKNRFSVSNLNADAPAFTPSFASETTPKGSSFTFTSAVFNVEAPEFNPSRSPGTNFRSSVTSPDEGNATNTHSIFGNVVIAPSAKVTRRASKPVPVLGSKPKEILDSDSDSDSIDETGRPMAPADRQKRARRQGSDGDEDPVFADSGPFHHRRILSEIVDAVESDGSKPENPKKHFDGWAYIPADASQLTNPELLSAQEETEEVEEAAAPDSAFTFRDEKDAAMFNEARPPLGVDQRLETDQVDGQEPFDGEEGAVSSVKLSDPPENPVRYHRSSLSALARPFEFNLRISRSAATSLTSPPQSRGLEASKYADPPSPPTELTANLSSPPADLPHFVEKAHDSLNDADDTVEVIEEEGKTSEDDIVEVIEEISNDDEDIVLRQISEPTKGSEVAPPMEEDEFDMARPSSRHHDQPVPSFEEIDAVMKHLEENPELGVERNDTPIQSTPLIDMHLASNFRSDAPSPSPCRPYEGKTAQSDASYPPSYGLGIGVHNLNSTRDNVSDWGDAMSAPEAAKLQLRSQFFDGHVSDLVDGILESRLGPLEHTLQAMQNSLALIATQPKPKKDRPSVSTEKKESDADDEDEYDAFEGFSTYRSQSPAARREDRKNDQIRAAVVDAMAAYQPLPPPQQTVDMTEINTVLQEIKHLAQQSGSQNTQVELKTIMEDVISTHPRLRGSRVRDDHDTAEMKLKPQIDGLESMLKISQEHAAEEARLRRKGEEEINELKLRLRIAEEEAAQYRESSEEAQQTLEAFVEEKDSYRNLEHELEGLTLKNTALENTLEEYRVSSDQWREDIRDERASNKDLKRTLKEVHKQLEEQTRSRQGLRAKIERVQSRMIQAIEDMHAEQDDWRNKEHALQSRLAIAQDSLEQEKRHREKAELELDTLDKEHKANLHLKTLLEQAQLDVSQLNELTAGLREENRALHTKSFNLDRELTHTKNIKDAELATSTAKLQVELQSALAQMENLRIDSEAQIVRMQDRLDNANVDLEEHKTKHHSLFTETVEAHQQALREANEKKETALEDQHQVHEKKQNELRDRHSRELHNSFDNRSRLEHQFNERQSLSDDKIKHLESKVGDLEDRLAITKSAARAAVEAATAKGANLPTPASSVVASPPQRAASASLSFARGSEVPEKISPQALRESIMVLQDQLQNREQKIEQLELELSAVDKEAPARVKERDTEIGWLRELLGVRVDDLEDLTNALSKPDFDRDTVRDAAIRLRANLQMERQLRDRAAAGSSNSFPSIASLSSYAQSPRAIPMAAAAAWGNWRRARDTSIGALSELATNLGSQTPSKSTLGSPASFLSGMITPPATNQKTPTSSDTPFQAPPTMRPLAAAASQARKSGGPEARPLRAYSSQPRTLSSRQADKRPGSSHSVQSSLPSQLTIDPPRTPTQAKNQPSLDLTEDLDDDASPLDGKDTGRFGGGR